VSGIDNAKLHAARDERDLVLANDNLPLRLGSTKFAFNYVDLDTEVKGSSPIPAREIFIMFSEPRVLLLSPVEGKVALTEKLLTNRPELESDCGAGNPYPLPSGPHR
jgi:hypothetical protein